jgi:hypothetical protein
VEVIGIVEAGEESNNCKNEEEEEKMGKSNNETSKGSQRQNRVLNRRNRG